jgi:hypothetical protein
MALTNMQIILLAAAVFVIYCSMNSENLTNVEKSWVNSGLLADSVHGNKRGYVDEDTEMKSQHLQELAAARQTARIKTLTEVSEISRATRGGHAVVGVFPLGERSKHLNLIRQASYHAGDDGMADPLDTRATASRYRGEHSTATQYLDDLLNTQDGHKSALAVRSSNTRS